MKLIPIANAKGTKQLIDKNSLNDYYKTLETNVNNRLKSRLQEEKVNAAQQAAAEAQAASDKANSFGGLALETGKGVLDILKNLGINLVGTTKAVGADVLNVLQPWKSPDQQIKSVSFGGQEFQTPSSKGAEAGRLAAQGQYEQAAGKLGEAGLDIISTVYTPFKGVSILKGGKIVNGVLQGALTGGVYGSGYGLTQGLSEGKDAAGVLKSTVEGGAIGTAAGGVLGGGTGLIGKIFARKQELKVNDNALVEIAGKPKTQADFLASRQNLSVVPMEDLGKDINGDKVISRLEWNYKKNRGIIMATPKANEANIAHEIGHYLEKTYPDMPAQFKSEVVKLSGGNNTLNEDFAYSIMRVLTDPEARTLAPELTKRVEEIGIKPSDFAKAEPTVKTETAPVAEKPVKEKPITVQDYIKTKKENIKVENSLLADIKSKEKTVKQMEQGYLQDEKANFAMLREQTPFSYDPDLEYQYGSFKDLIRRFKTEKQREAILNGDVDQIKRVLGHKVQPEQIDHIFYSQDQSENEVLDMFRAQLEQDKNRPTRDTIAESAKRRMASEPDYLKAQDELQAARDKYDAHIAEQNKTIDTVNRDLTMQTAPSAVLDDAKVVYQKARANGKSKVLAEKEAVAKVEHYEATVDKQAKDVPVIKTIKETRTIPTGPTPKEKVKTEGIKWDSLNTSDETKNVLDKVFAENDQFRSVRPSRTNKDILEGARALDINVNDPKQLDAFLSNMPNANVAVKLKQMMVDSASDLMNYLKTVDSGHLTESQLKTIRDKFLRTQAIAKSFAGIRTEASHLFRSMGLEVFEGENMTELATALKGIVPEADGDALKFLSKSQKVIAPTAGSTATSVWYNSILSGWKTWARNILDNTGILATETFSKAANPMTAKESARFVAGLFRAFPEAVKRSKNVLFGKTEITGKLDAKTIGKWQWQINHPKLNFLLTEISGRALESQDAFFGTLVEEAQKNASRWEGALTKAGVSDDAAKQLDKAFNQYFAERTTYRNTPTGYIGAASAQIGGLTKRVPPLRFIIPFVRVVANVIDRKVDYLPFLNIFRTFGKKYINEEASHILKKTTISPALYDELTPLIAKRLKQQQLGRLYLGTLATIGFYGLAQQGKVSGGGPADKNKRKQMIETGWRPYSIKIGDTWYPYNYFGPLSGILAAVGEINDKQVFGAKKDDYYKRISKGLVGFTGSMLNQSFLSGVSDLMDVVNGYLAPDQYIRNLVVGIVPIPAMYTQTAQLFDRRSFDVKTFSEALQYKLGITKNLTPRLNALGEEIRTDLIYGISPSEERNNLSKEFDKRGFKVNIPAANTTLNGVPMTREQLFRYTIIRGELIKKNAQNILTAVDKQKDQNLKERSFSNAIDDLGQLAKRQLSKELGIPFKASTQSVPAPKIPIKL